MLLDFERNVLEFGGDIIGNAMPYINDPATQLWGSPLSKANLGNATLDFGKSTFITFDQTSASSLSFAADADYELAISSLRSTLQWLKPESFIQTKLMGQTFNTTITFFQNSACSQLPLSNLTSAFEVSS